MAPRSRGPLEDPKWPRRPKVSRGYIILATASVLALVALTIGNQVEAKRQSRQHRLSPTLLAQLKEDEGDVDPMEPCYLANNRASESLTISESTPVGTVVGELMVNGDSSASGNIELSIRMPGGHLAPSTSGSGPASSADSNGGTHGSTSQRLVGRPTNGYVAGQESAAAAANVSSSTTTTTATSGQQQPQPLSNKELGNLIDLMPPLSIDHETKRLILAKKLDRENLDKYLALASGAYQASYSTFGGASGSGSSNNGGQFATSSASLTVHVKCQLKRTIANSTSKSMISTTATSAATTNKNSILIPIHLIVTDENDNWPVFINAPYIVDLNETATVGSLLPNNEIVAVDHDQQGPLSTIEYSVVAGSLYSDSFGFLNPLDSRSLIVKDTKYLDYESQSKITLKIMARDQGEPPNWAITSLYVNLFDQDDLNPMFTEDKYYAHLKDNRPGEVIDVLPKRLAARDGDKSLNSPLVYSFHLKTNQSIHFDLDQDLAILKLKKSMPMSSEQQPFCLLIRATQVDNPRRWSLSAINMRPSRAVQLQQQQQQQTQTDNPALEHLLSLSSEASADGKRELLQQAPEAFRFSHSNYTVEVSESAPIGFTVLNLRASFGRREADGVSYQLLDDHAYGYFRLDASTGRLTLNKSLDYELYRQVSVRVLATLEYYEENLSASQTNYPKLVCDITRVNVQVVNQNEFAPEFSHEQYNFQLSISDLIANFEPPPPPQQVAPKPMDSNDLRGFQHQGDHRMITLNKRSGDLMMVDEMSESLDDPLGYRAMQLGQIYCADRDYGDKISLKLSGPKANLFHLTQEGRLYLPLTNLSNNIDLMQDSSVLSRRISTADGSTWPSASKIISSQFVQSKFASFHGSSMKRQDLGAETADRKHLNYLLSELSNLGRLRLKVLASDDGQPEVRQSTSVIVVSVISIDNFILQQAPPLTPATGTSDQANASQSNSTGTGSAEEQTGQSVKDTNKAATGQLMVISTSSGNGKGFVQINPDIIGNLFNNRSSSTQQDHMQSSASSVSSSQASPFQPPSLLLVDDEGAKFVAMPAAVEAYSRRVLEASEQMQMAAANRRSLLNSQASGSSLWTQVKNWFGLGGANNSVDADKSNIDSTESRSPLYWLNLSTAIMLHLIVIALVVTLLVKSRSSFNASSGIPNWPMQLISKFRFDRRMRRSHDSSPIGILTAQDQVGNHSSYGQVNGNLLDQHSGASSSASSSDGSACNANQDNKSYAFMRHQQLASGITGAMKQRQQNQSISKGVVVSAMSQGHLTSSGSSNLIANSTSYLPTEGDTNRAQNLLGHLKVTLNKMLDSDTSDKNNGCIGEVTVRALDSDCSLDYGSRQVTSPPLMAHQTAAMSPASPNQSSKLADRAGKSSTFIGHIQQQQQVARSPSMVAKRETQKTTPALNSPPTNSTLGGATTVISIKVSKPSTSSSVDTNPSPKLSRQLANSSSSSVVSLATSTSSSISNKINAGLSKTHSNANGVDHTTSDISSVDSATLFNGLATSRSANSSDCETSALGSQSQQSPTTSHLMDKAPAPPPPPPPPPPSLSQMSPSGVSSTTDSLRGKTKPFSAPPSMADPLVAAAAATPSNKRRPLPQNPVHVRLRQQAASQPPVPSNKPEVAEQQSPKCTHQQQQPTRQRKSQMESPKQHRAPPSLPTNLTVSSQTTKTVSPTTSVDRGYESFQSYTFSSQSTQMPPVAPPPPPPPPVPMPPSNQRQRHLATSTESSLVARSRHLIAAQSQPKREAANSRSAQGRPSAAVKRPTGHRSQQHPIQSTSAHDCETEDDDLYYCYANGNGGPPVDHYVDHQQQQMASSGDLLSEYASHVYQEANHDHGQLAHHLECDEVEEIMQTLHQQQIKFRPLPQSIPTGGSGYPTGSLRRLQAPNQSDLSKRTQQQQQQQQQQHQQQQQRSSHHNRKSARSTSGQAPNGNRSARGGQLQYAANEQAYHYYGAQSRPHKYPTNQSHNHSQANGTKKQLTWSDQVDVA